MIWLVWLDSCRPTAWVTNTGHGGCAVTDSPLLVKLPFSSHQNLLEWMPPIHLTAKFPSEPNIVNCIIFRHLGVNCGRVALVFVHCTRSAASVCLRGPGGRVDRAPCFYLTAPSHKLTGITAPPPPFTHSGSYLTTNLGPRLTFKSITLPVVDLKENCGLLTKAGSQPCHNKMHLKFY